MINAVCDKYDFRLVDNRDSVASDSNNLDIAQPIGQNDLALWLDRRVPTKILVIQGFRYRQANVAFQSTSIRDPNNACKNSEVDYFDTCIELRPLRRRQSMPCIDLSHRPCRFRLIQKYCLSTKPTNSRWPCHRPDTYLRSFYACGSSSGLFYRQSRNIDLMTVSIRLDDRLTINIIWLRTPVEYPPSNIARNFPNFD